MKNTCKWLYADWCHCPDFDEQELCPFYLENDKAKVICKQYKVISKGE